jgi:hypothetical protein
VFNQIVHVSKPDQTIVPVALASVEAYEPVFPVGYEFVRRLGLDDARTTDCRNIEMPQAKSVIENGDNLISELDVSSPVDAKRAGCRGNCDYDCPLANHVRWHVFRPSTAYKEYVALAAANGCGSNSPHVSTMSVA